MSGGVKKQSRLQLFLSTITALFGILLIYVFFNQNSDFSNAFQSVSSHRESLRYVVFIGIIKYGAMLFGMTLALISLVKIYTIIKKSFNELGE